MNFERAPFLAIGGESGRGDPACVHCVYEPRVAYAAGPAA